jgi:hypothetical protein
MLYWLRQQLRHNMFEMISFLGFNMEFIMSLQVWIASKCDQLIKSAASQLHLQPC